MNALNSSLEADQAEIQLLRASTLELNKLVFAVADVPALLSRSPHPDAPAAWLGTPFLSAFQLTLDPPPLNSITLRKPSTKLPHPKQSTVAKIEMRDGRPYVQVSVPGAKPFWALIDTSAPGNSIPTEVADKLKLKPVKVEPVSWRDGKPGQAAVAVLPRLAIGKAGVEAGARRLPDFRQQQGVRSHIRRAGDGLHRPVQDHHRLPAQPDRALPARQTRAGANAGRAA